MPEQCVLAEYIQSGELSRQSADCARIIRKRRIPDESSSWSLWSGIVVAKLVSGIYCHVRLHSPLSESDLLKKAEQQGCRVLSMQSFYETPSQETDNEFLLSFSKIPSCKLRDAVAALHAAWSEKEDNNGEKFAVYSMRRSSFRKPVP